MRMDERVICAKPSGCTSEAPICQMTDEEIEEFKRKLEEKSEIEAAQRRIQREKEDAEVTELMAELTELRKLVPREEINLEEELREAEAYYKGVPMYDWGAREMSNEHDMSQKYGSKITNEIRRYLSDAERIPKSLIAEMHRIHEGRSPARRVKVRPHVQPNQETQEPRISQVSWTDIREKRRLEPRHYRNDQFSTVKAGLFNVARGNSELRNPTTLLLYLLQNRAWEGKKDKHDTYGNWYLKKRLIVASIGIEKICADLGVHEKTVRNWTNALHKSGVIRKLKEGKESVYVLGEVIDNKELFYYSGEISWQPNPGCVH